MIYLMLVLAVIITVPLLREHRRRSMDDTARSGAPGSFATLPQGVTHYSWAGPAEGPVVICVHGLTTPSFVWQGVRKVLVAFGFRVLVYDLYGRGYSDRPRGAQDAAFFIRQLSDLMTHQEVREPVTLIGYSMGGAIATAFAATHPDRMRQLILLAPAGIQHNTGKLIAFVRNWRFIGDWLMLALYPYTARKSIAAEAHLPSSVPNITEPQKAELAFRGYIPAILASLRGLLAQDQKAEHLRVAAAKIPTIAVWGEKDEVIPLTALATFAEWNRHAHQEVVEGAGHGLTYTHTEQILSYLVPRLIR